MSRAAPLDWPRGSRLLLLKYERIGIPTCSCYPPIKKRCFSGPQRRFSSTSSVRRQDGVTPLEPNEYQKQLGRTAKEKLADKNFFFSLLSSASTKREAKSYLSRFKAEKSTPSKPLSEQRDVDYASTNFVQSGVNLGGGMFGMARAVDNHPVFRQETIPESSPPAAAAAKERLHIALVKLREPQFLNDQTLGEIGRTLSQLSLLGMGCCVVIDPSLPQSGPSWRSQSIEQADRMLVAIDANNDLDSRRLDDVIRVAKHVPSVASRELILSPLRRGRIVVIPPIGYTEDTLRAVPVLADDVVLALTKEFTGLSVRARPDDNPLELARRISKLQGEVSVDRLIILDPAGGIPSLKRPSKSHVFVNLEQEFEEIRDELREGMVADDSLATNDKNGGQQQISSLARSNPFSTFVEREVVSLPREQGARVGDRRNIRTADLETHLGNLNLLRSALTYLPPSSSGIITTPQDAANSASSSRDPQLSTVATRRQRNPLIHNLLTDKPSHSASLPAGRLGAYNGSSSYHTNPVTHSTFVKKGMPLTLFPDPRLHIWKPPINGESQMTLNDPHIDLPRLVQLIEDSFNRKLDVQHYLNRVSDRLAGLIIAGEYEGGAVLTWELPPGVPNDGSEESRSRMVPYLDKFAVLKRSQGAGGVADIVFNAMVRTCLPRGVCWRSRHDNPVNKWYFERARGTWKLPGSNWTMFWTTDGVPENDRIFRDYEGICRGIEPSWADNKHVVD
ncbi:amino-acid acetyltransferase, mitochondrial [Blastomyces percursus]|uniref:Amino-acid acetyltransferase, mitochondrial n=1 Tax=Blastomyces percursus TaxID=1658174 RepID=A0A1J9R066_9EURO|nr:amino-acid acetyltransferase, mitochondrial [Blastomyces percursus]